MLKVIGTHCYLGGFLLGLQQAGLQILESEEVWKPGLRGAQALGSPSKEVSQMPDDLPEANIVVGNPPCSRFSHLSLSFFDKKTHEDPETFPEILDLVKVAKASRAQVIWWETGPLSWTLGRGLLANFHNQLYDVWDNVTTLLARLDLRYIGIPQRRPRVHIIHAHTSNKPPSVPEAVWPSDYKVGDWLKSKTEGYELKRPVFSKETDNPVAWAEKQDMEMKFRSVVPKVISREDWYTGSVLSRRIMVWREENRWFDFLEHAALMTYPLDKILNILSIRPRPLEAQVLISKSVAPAASKWVAENILLPWLNNQSGTGPIQPITHRRNFWELDLTIPSKIDQALRTGQRPLIIF